MAINRVKSAGIQDATITGDDIATNTIANSNVATNAVSSTNIASGVITTTQINSSAGITNSQLASSSFTINDTAVSLGSSGTITGGLEWQAKVVADGSTQLNTSAGKGYFLDTNAGVIEVFLPSSPSLGDSVVIVDYGGQFATNNVIVNTGGQLIDSTAGGPGTSNDFFLDTSNSVTEFLYTDSSRGWILITSTTIA